MGRDVCLTFKHSILMSEMRLFSWSVSLKLIYPERVSCGRWVFFPQRTKYTLFWVHHSPYSVFLKVNGTACICFLPTNDEPYKYLHMQIVALLTCSHSLMSFFLWVLGHCWDALSPPSFPGWSMQTLTVWPEYFPAAPVLISLQI